MLIHDVSKFADKKLAALFSHKSQAQLMVGLAEQYQQGVPEIVERVNSERFWTYKFS